MKVTLISPGSRVEAERMVRVAWLSAARCRSYLGIEELREKVEQMGIEVVGKKIWGAVKTEWAVDILRHTLFTFDWEDVPTWAWTELWRHQFVVRNVWPEQMSQRALNSTKLKVLNEFEGGDKVEFELIIARVNEFMERMGRSYGRDVVRNASFQGTLSSGVLSMNAETIHHLVVMRGSVELMGGEGGKAALVLQDAIGQTWDRAREVCPWLFQEVLKR